MKRILVVEDEASIRELVALNLKMTGWEVLEAPSAERALELIQKNPPCDVALLDIMLPGMDGFSLCETIRHGDPYIGIIMASAKGQESDKIRGLSIGADDYITKPFSVSELMARVEALARRVRRSATADDEQAGSEPDQLVSGPFVLDEKSRMLYKNGRWNFRSWSCFSATPALPWCAKRSWKAFGARGISAMSRSWMSTSAACA